MDHRSESRVVIGGELADLAILLRFRVYVWIRATDEPKHAMAHPILLRRIRSPRSPWSAWLPARAQQESGCEMHRLRAGWPPDSDRSSGDRAGWSVLC